LCNCAPKCEESESFCDSIQYGKYHGTKNGHINNEKMLTSIMLYVKPEQRLNFGLIYENQLNDWFAEFSELSRSSTTWRNFSQAAAEHSFFMIISVITNSTQTDDSKA
jgi:hypothetical protein